MKSFFVKNKKTIIVVITFAVLFVASYKVSNTFAISFFHELNQKIHHAR